jgi:hypothetical protein
MELSQEQLKQILYKHNALWNALYDFDSDFHCLQHEGRTYDIYIPAQRGYASVILPNPKGTNFLWITQNLNKSTYGSQAIQRARDKNQDHRITWIVDTRNGQFNYRTNITTTVGSDGELIRGEIEIYDSLGQETIWSTNKSMITKKAKF